MVDPNGNGDGSANGTGTNGGSDAADPYRGGRLNPFNFPHRLSQYRSKDPDEDKNAARRVQDPHTWENPDPSLRERITPNTTAGWMGLLVAFFLGGSFILYLFPLIAPAFRNPVLLGIAIVVSFLILFHLWSRQVGWNAAVRLDKHVVYYGDQVDFRLGEHAGTDGRSELFTPYVDVTYGGFNAKPLKKRQLPYAAGKLRSHLGDPDSAGQEPVKDRMNQTTAKVETENYGTIWVTHAETMEFDEFGRESDRFTTRPQTIDEDVARNMNELIESLETSIGTLKQQVTMLEERTNQIRDTRQFSIIRELEGTISLMEQLNDRMAGHALGNGNGSSPATNGRGQSARDRAVQEIINNMEDE